VVIQEALGYMVFVSHIRLVGLGLDLPDMVTFCCVMGVVASAMLPDTGIKRIQQYCQTIRTLSIGCTSLVLSTKPPV